MSTSENNWNQNSKLVLEQLKFISEEIKTLKADLNTHRFIAENKITTIESRLQSIDKEISLMLKVVRDGNGRLPLVLEVELLKERQENIDKKLEESDVKSKWRIEKIMALGAMIISVASVILDIIS